MKTRVAGPDEVVVSVPVTQWALVAMSAYEQGPFFNDHPSQFARLKQALSDALDGALDDSTPEYTYRDSLGMSMHLEIPLYATVIDAATPGEMRTQIDRHIGHGLEVLGWWAEPWTCDQTNHPLWQSTAHVTVGIKETRT